MLWLGRLKVKEVLCLENTHVYDNVLIGASVFSLGFAETHANTIILEPTEMMGGEFTSCFKRANVRDVQPGKGSKLYDYMNTYKLIDEAGEVNTLKLSPVIYKLVMDNNVPVMLLTKVIDVKEKENMFEVRVYSNSGLKTVLCKRIIDTTTYCDTKYNEGLVAEKKMNVLHNKVVNGANQINYTEFAFTSGITASEARKEITGAWLKRYSEASPDHAPITAIGFDFEYTHNIGRLDFCEKWIWLANSVYTNPLDAYHAGLGFQCRA